MNREITMDTIKHFKETFNKNPNNKIMENIISTNGIRNIAKNKEAINRNRDVFSIELPKVKITDQKNTMRCWAFAGLNLLKREVANNLNIKLDNVELSQNYIIFYDKLEKANNFYEWIIEFKDRDLLDRDLLELLNWGLYEGGHWEYFVGLVNKYGVVPKEIMPETKDSEDSGILISILSSKIRKDASKLRKILKNCDDIIKIRQEKQKMLNEVYDILCKTLGEPPSSFKYEYIDQNGKYNIVSEMTPIEFYNQYVGTSLSDYVMVANVPMHNKKFNSLYKEREYISNIIDNTNHYFLNVELEDIKSLVVKSLKDSKPVYFACNIARNNNRDLKILDYEMYQYGKVLGIDLEMSKEELLDYREIRLEHMMLFVGVNIINDKIERWKVEDSSGYKEGNQGYYIMNDNFFDKYVVECVINKKYMTKKQLKLLEQEPIIFNPWEPMS
ncbi:MAG: aminopeptidase C [Ignavibacteriales bacterium]